MWSLAGVPVRTEKSIQTKLKRLTDRASNVSKRRSSATAMSKFVESLSGLFDISAHERNIPFIERAFLKDQQNEKKLFIGSVDKKLPER